MGFWTWLTGQDNGPTGDAGTPGENRSASQDTGQTASAVADADEARTETPWWAPANAGGMFNFRPSGSSRSCRGDGIGSVLALPWCCSWPWVMDITTW